MGFSHLGVEFMADPVDLVLTHLSGLRADMAKVTKKLDAQDKRFDKLDERLGPQDYKITDAMRYAALANLGAQNAEARALEVAEKQKRLEQQMEDFDRRLRRIETPGAEG
jgi:septation ring formation regulator EzrA